METSSCKRLALLCNSTTEQLNRELQPRASHFNMMYVTLRFLSPTTLVHVSTRFGVVVLLPSDSTLLTTLKL
eukprot:3133001-Amphidinium_carterae.1